MSDQPTSGEWTAEFVHDLERWGWKKIADAHNAALTAEREKIPKWYQELYQSALDAERELRDQLAAESEQSEQVGAAQRHMNACRGLLKVPESEVLYDAIVELQEQLSAVTVALTKADTQLAAEREKAENLLVAAFQAEEQLAAERERTDNQERAADYYGKQLAVERERLEQATRRRGEGVTDNRNNDPGRISGSNS